MAFWSKVVSQVFNFYAGNKYDGKMVKIKINTYRYLMFIIEENKGSKFINSENQKRKKNA